MTEHKFKPGIAQRVIHVSLREVGDNIAAFYTYVSPLFGTSYIDAPVCEIKCDRPTFTLYVLDFVSTLNGWTIQGADFLENPDDLTATAGPEHLSLQVFNPHNDDTSVGNFFIVYTNPNYRHGKLVPIDPQEGNIPPMFPE
ncbi:hypothetical protein RCH14_003100 [Massilia sp. MP_M2]|uniref:hypothetical protein n=1 Tax=Massilia sp. MP_M2 TaxID=3071713 RepID=UPI00319D9ED5